MRKITVLALVASMLTLAACSGKGVQELYDTAQFEEKQHNLEHATKLYEEIVAKHPQSELAARAKERLEAIKAGK
ncbi:lipoprotein [Geobacter sulfurreducens]|jgi:outer membrane protein assembly factor BamD (BamD/ComL family)|uniref:Lipoprotein, putative n=1 Tax=Geobacter sulfurreducens (strain ATCC 51573 / DSM 12127 / PCA) TaxID=243231 RepID=Q74G67_GEOSL|nr:lipoprotein [Geobacter sulfurreducens]AAR33713.1 lipoprotein, putative [Geobacter sulfurreducens PCA]ADI83212.1 lipoprotein, putative [Geobacter sulfurreducens KN400]AJY70105.1 hypothetical protein RW64_11145 [Geobacter sulfurreducens]QVW35638.1 lipoprotein [Geobacter sulfurreducens]UAC04462.1 lipoprotein [Geobacter sulfurreducens]